jgi:ATP-dependent Clp protease ATP-binding subunit ClpX
MGKAGGMRRCSFCGKPEDQVRRLIAGGKGVFICDGCVLAASELIAEHDAKDTQ